MLELVNVGRKFDPDDWVFRGIGARFEPGELILIKGGSGAGKSTLLRIMGLIDAPTVGRVSIDGVDAWSIPDAERARLRRDHIGHVFQAHNMIPDLSVLENVLLPMRIGGRRPDTARAIELLGAVGLQGKESRLPAQLSMGERQRASFARAMANDPKILIADEPTSSLDAKRAAEIIDLLLSFWNRGRTVIAASHDARVWSRFAKARTFELAEGSLLSQ
ncbi:MAG: ABC transporter ATP-binding protein [Thermoplasmatota archaeon]